MKLKKAFVLSLRYFFLWSLVGAVVAGVGQWLGEGWLGQAFGYAGIALMVFGFLLFQLDRARGQEHNERHEKGAPDRLP